MREFTFDKTYEEFKVANKVYKFDFNDESIKRYFNLMETYDEKVKGLKELDSDITTPEETFKAFEEGKTLLKEVLEGFLGEGTFDELYEASGRSTDNIKIFVEWISYFIAEKLKERKKESIQKYKK